MAGASSTFGTSVITRFSSIFGASVIAGVSSTLMSISDSVGSGATGFSCN